jgi:GNAT superfamily N-acetyltransferase
MMRIRKYRKADAREVAGLISRTYWEFNRREGSGRAVGEYVAMFDPRGKSAEEIHRRLARTPYAFVAVEGKRIVGVGRGVNNRIINLFVDGSHHRRGIGTGLLKKLEEAICGAGARVIVLRSSLLAVRFYQMAGSKKRMGARRFHGLWVQPMRKVGVRL